MDSRAGDVDQSWWSQNMIEETLFLNFRFLIVLVPPVSYFYQNGSENEYICRIGPYGLDLIRNCLHFIEEKKREERKRKNERTNERIKH